MDLDYHSPSLDLSFKELERFVAVVERGGLGEAARALGVTQQALGRSLTKLEAVVGAKLLNRSKGTQTSPTLYGEAFLRYAKGQLSSMAQALKHMQLLAGSGAGSVALGIGETCDIQAMGKILRDFHRSNPEVQIDLVEGYTDALLDQLVEGRLDCVVGSIPENHYTRQGVVHNSLYSIDDIVVARAQHPLLRKKAPVLQDLQDYTWLVARRRAGDWTVIRDAFHAEGLDPPQRIIRTDAVLLGMELMLTDDYLFMGPPTFVETGESGSLLKSVPVARPTITRHSGLMTMSRRELSPATVALIGLIQASVSGPEE